jgi:hypothetical protein
MALYKTRLEASEETSPANTLAQLLATSEKRHCCCIRKKEFSDL